MIQTEENTMTDIADKLKHKEQIWGENKQLLTKRKKRSENKLKDRICVF